MHASVHSTEHLLFSVLLQLIVIIGAARFGNALFRAIGQPGAVGEIVAGLLLGPSLFGHLFPNVATALFGAKPDPAISILSQIGLVLLMFQIGCGFAFERLDEPRVRRVALAVALPSVVVPFGLGVAIGWLSADTLAPAIDPLTYSLFCGVALAITAVPILGRILVEHRMERTEIGVIAIAAATFNDVAGWLMLAVVSAYATAHLTGASVAFQIGGLVLFMVVLRTLLAPMVDRVVARMPLIDGALAPNLIAAILCLIFALALCTYTLGIFAIFGGFAAGLLFHCHHAVAAAWQKQVGQFVLTFFLPIFFTFTGLRTNLLGLTIADLPWLLLIMAAAILGKIVPVALAARSAGLETRPAFTLGALMNTRALMELIVLNVGYELGVLPQSMFTMLVVMAVATTLMTGPLLRLLLAPAQHVKRLRADA
jgi:Kef-type K+ transport system membrane component KefB